MPNINQILHFKYTPFIICNYTLVNQRWTLPKGEGGEEMKGKKEERKGKRGISAL